MKRFKHWKTSSKILTPLIIGFIIIVTGIAISAHYKFNEAALEAAQQNCINSQRISFLAYRAANGDKAARDELEKTANLFENTLNTLKNGGMLPENEAVIYPANIELQLVINQTTDFWKEFSKRVHTIINEPLTIAENIEHTVDIDTLGNPVTKSSEIKTTNPNIAPAIDYISENSYELLKHSLLILNEYKKQNKQRLMRINYILLATIGAVFVITVIGFLLSKEYIVNPLLIISQTTESLAKGNLKQSISLKYKNEIGAMIKSLQFLKTKLSEKVKFIIELTKGNYEAEFQIVSEDDELGKSLLKMRENFLHAAQEEEKRKEEDEKQNWMTQGLARMGEILRQDNDNIETLSFNVISYLVNFLNANQGGFFVINDDDEKDKFVQQVAGIAYNRRKYAKKRLEFGEGVIGRCILEAKTIYMTELPNDYIEVTSGLGKATPNCLLVVPLQFNKITYGVIEIASFHVFEQYKIEFMEKVAESIASTIATVKINLQTTDLLKESQKQADLRAQQEEKLRQNVEKLRATQDEARRQEEKLRSFTDSVNHTLIRAEYKTDGTLIYANTKFIEKLGYHSAEEIYGRHISIFIDEKDKGWFNEMWEPLSKGGKHYEGNMKHKTELGTDLWMMATFTAVRRTSDNIVEKILFLGIDTTDQKKESLNHKGQIDALERSSIKVEYSPTGKLLKCNQLFLDTLGYKEIEVQASTAFDFLDRNDLSQFKVIWDNAVNEISYKGEVKLLTQTGEEKWFNATFSAVKDMYDEVDKIIFIANETTEQKLMEIKTQQQAEELKAKEKKLLHSMNDLNAMQEVMAKRQEELKETNDKLIDNETALKNALQEAQEKERMINDINQQLKANEEELRQNLEELQTTQEEAARRAVELGGIIDAINNSALMIEFDMKGYITDVNENFSKKVDINQEDLLRKNHKDFNSLAEDEQEYNKFWKALSNGIPQNVISLIKLNDKEIWLSESYTPIKDNKNSYYKVLNIATDITETKKQEFTLRAYTKELTMKEKAMKRTMQKLKTSKQELSEKNNRIQALNYAVDTAILKIELDTNQIIKDINEKYATLLEYSKEELTGKKLSQVVLEEDIEDVNKIWKTLLEGKSYEGEVKRKTKSGGHKWILLTYTPNIKSDGTVSDIFMLGYDITKNKELEFESQLQADELVHAENELRKHVEELQKTQDAMKVERAELKSLAEAIDNTMLKAEFSLDGTIIQANNTFIHSTGYTRDEILGNHVRTLIDNDRLIAFNKIWNKLLQGDSFIDEFRMVTKNGERWYMVSYTPASNKEGKIHKIYFLAQDITKTKLLELEAKQKTKELRAQDKELRQNLEELQTAQEEMLKKENTMNTLIVAIERSTLMMELDLSGKVANINENFAKLFRLKPEEMIGKHHADFNQTAKNEKLYKKLWDDLHKEKSKKRVSQIVIGDKTIWLSETYTPIMDEEGKLIKVLIIAANITELKTLEEKALERGKALNKSQKEIEIYQKQITKHKQNSTLQGLAVINATSRIAVENYLQNIRRQLTTLSQNPFFIQAFTEFSDSFKQLSQPYTDKQIKDMQEANHKFYEKSVIPQWNKIGIETLNTNDLLTPDNEQTIVAQYFYLTKNRFTYGNRHQLINISEKNKYNKAHQKYHTWFLDYQNKFSIHDIFLINNDLEHIIYTCQKNIDFGMPLKSKLLKSLPFSKTIQELRKATEKDIVTTTDFLLYLPSKFQPVWFVLTPVVDKGKNIGTIALQLHAGNLNAVLKKQHATGFIQKTGDIYIVGDDNTLRSNPILLQSTPEKYYEILKTTGYDKDTINKMKKLNTAVKLQTIDNKIIESIKSQGSGQIQATGISNEKVYASFATVQAADVNWTLVSETDYTTD